MEQQAYDPNEKVSWVEYHEFFAKQHPHPMIHNSALKISGWKERQEARKLKPNTKVQIVFVPSTEFPPYTRAEWEQLKVEFMEMEARREEDRKRYAELNAQGQSQKAE